MKTVDIQDADFPALVEQAAAGEEILIEKAGEPFARLMPPEKKTPRRPGAMKGQIWMSDDFDAASSGDASSGTPFRYATCPLITRILLTDF